MMQAKERLWLTADRARLVPEGHADAATLYAAIGDRIPDSAAARFGLADGGLPTGEEAPAEGDATGPAEGGGALAEGGKEQKDAADKERGPEGDNQETGGGLSIRKRAKGKD